MKAIQRLVMNVVTNSILQDTQRIIGHMTMNEKDIVKNVALYLQMQFPDAIYRFDIAADLVLTVGQARRNKTLHPKRGFPDLSIAEPKRGRSGLYIELKIAGTKLLRSKDAKKILTGDSRKRLAGDWFNLHIEEQADFLKRLHRKNYYATFACGYDQTIEIIDWYFGKTSRIPDRPEVVEAVVIRSQVKVKDEEIF